MKAKKPSYADLLRKTQELTAQLPCMHGSAYADIKKAGKAHLMSSGVIVRLHALGGREIVPAFLISDGLSDATIGALKQDIKESFNRSNELALILLGNKSHD